MHKDQEMNIYKHDWPSQIQMNPKQSTQSTNMQHMTFLAWKPQNSKKAQVLLFTPSPTMPKISNLLTQ